MKYLLLLVVLVFLVYGVMFANSTHRADRESIQGYESDVMNYIACVFVGCFALAVHIWDGVKYTYNEAVKDLKP